MGSIPKNVKKELIAKAEKKHGLYIVVSLGAIQRGAKDLWHDANYTTYRGKCIFWYNTQDTSTHMVGIKI